MSIRIGANPICWANDDMPELGGDTSLETILSEAKQIGFEGLELGKKLPRTPEALTAALAPYGLACISGWYSAKLLTRDAEAEFAAMAKHLIDLDDETLNAARAELGTATIKETVNVALQRVTQDRGRKVAAALDVLAKADLDDRVKAWR